MVSLSRPQAARFVVAALLLTGCGATAPPATVSGEPTAAVRSRGEIPLPAIDMTSGGGFDGQSESWTIAVDGWWTYTYVSRVNSAPATARHGQLTDDQRRELALMADDIALHTEMRKARSSCEVSDGPSERLQVGPIRYVASWCDEYRPLIRQFRARIRSLTTGP